MISTKTLVYVLLMNSDKKEKTECYDYAVDTLEKRIGPEGKQFLLSAGKNRRKNKAALSSILEGIRKCASIPKEEREVILSVFEECQDSEKILLPFSSILEMRDCGDVLWNHCYDAYLVRNYENFIRSLIKKHYSTYVSHYEELVHVGLIGLFQAMKNYNPELGEFTTHCKTYVLHEISGQVNFLNMDSTPHYTKLQKTIAAALDTLNAQGIEPTVQRVAMICHMKPSIVEREMKTDFYKKKMVYYDAEQDDSICEYDDTPESIVLKLDEHERLMESIERLAKIDKNLSEVVRLRFFEGCTNTEIAQRLGINIGAVKSLTHRSLTQLKKDSMLRMTYAGHLTSAEREVDQAVFPKTRSRSSVYSDISEIESMLGFDPGANGGEAVSIEDLASGRFIMGFAV